MEMEIKDMIWYKVNILRDAILYLGSLTKRMADNKGCTEEVLPTIESINKETTRFIEELKKLIIEQKKLEKENK